MKLPFSQPPEVFYKEIVVKMPQKLQEKTRSATSLKRDSNTRVFL